MSKNDPSPGGGDKLSTPNVIATHAITASLQSAQSGELRVEIRTSIRIQDQHSESVSFVCGKDLSSSSVRVKLHEGAHLLAPKRSRTSREEEKCSYRHSSEAGCHAEYKSDQLPL